MISFDFQSRTRIVFGAATLSQLGELARGLGGHRVLVVSDSGVIEAGHCQRATESLKIAGVEIALFDGVHENPSTKDVESGCQFAHEFKPDLLVGLGGGSSMDCAKGINFLFSNGGAMQDYWGIGKATKPMLPMIAVPTTAGTGSEAQSFALISDAKTHVKMACGDKKAAFRIAILDPELTVTQPSQVTALTGYDALAHAIETCVTKKRNELSRTLSRESWRLLATNLRQVFENPDDLKAREAMQLGACIAGFAIENSMLGAAHALANPLTARFGVIHGQAVALVLPAVVRFNAALMEQDYSELASILTPGDPTTSSLIGFLERVRDEVGLEENLANCGVEKSDLGSLATEAAKQWTAGFNPREVQESDLLELYQQVW